MDSMICLYCNRPQNVHHTVMVTVTVTVMVTVTVTVMVMVTVTVTVTVWSFAAINAFVP